MLSLHVYRRIGREWTHGPPLLLDARAAARARGPRHRAAAGERARLQRVVPQEHRRVRGRAIRSGVFGERCLPTAEEECPRVPRAPRGTRGRQSKKRTTLRERKRRSTATSSLRT